MFPDRLRAAQELISAHLEQVLAGFPDQPVTDAMRYALAGGKRLRGFLVLESAALHGISAAGAIDAAASVETLHAYSLVHDDLPAMDDDDLRRGQPAVHVKWDEATAILAGDALQALTFELLTPEVLGSAEARIALVRALARGAGGEGMVYGQALDIAAERAPQPLTLAEIGALQRAKTGALIEYSACAGAILAGAETAPLQTYARALGLAFQIADDILDVTGDAAVVGKRVGKDQGRGKATYVSQLGLEGARARARDLVAEAEAALDSYGAAAQVLKDCARYVIAREA